MSTDPEDIANTARIDQYRAQSEDSLNIAINEYRAMLDGPDETGPFSCLVAEIYGLVDPDDQLTNELSNRLVSVAETFACAVSRLAKASAQ
ncbi:MAG: hypothetical protein E6R06_21805 [Mycobacterium sp.]|nr:MAG: hypothetical protein E6R06_21805 [Mycobacterium sp.]